MNLLTIILCFLFFVPTSWAQSQKSCSLISKKPATLLINPKDNEQAFLQKILDLVRKENFSGVYEFLHPNIKDKKTAASFVSQFQNKLRKYGKSLDIANLRTWALVNPKGDPDAILCADDQISIFPTYSYTRQYTIWLQVMGNINLGRIYIQVVKDKQSKLFISNITIHQWSHFGKDPATWAREAEENLEEKDYLAAWLKFSIAKKLLSSNSYMQLPDTTYLQKKIAQLKEIHQPETIVKKAIEDYQTERISAAMTLDGISLLVYLRLKTPKNRWDREKQCQKMGKQLKTAKLLDNLAGIQCSFYYPNHNIKAKSPLGSVFWLKSKL